MLWSPAMEVDAPSTSIKISSVREGGFSIDSYLKILPAAG